MTGYLSQYIAPHFTVHGLEKMLFNNWYFSCQTINVQKNGGKLQEVSLSFISTSAFQPMECVVTTFKIFCSAISYRV
jgi:hypothetical protein